MHDQFLLISLFMPMFIISITERLYVYCSLTENISTSKIFSGLPIEKHRNCLIDEQNLRKS